MTGYHRSRSSAPGKAKIYEDKNYEGRYDLLSKSDPNLDIRSLGGQYSSAKVTGVISPPPSEIISNLKDNSPKTYVLDSCPDGKDYYIDRDYTMTEFSDDYFDGLTCIRTSNDDEANASFNLINFDLSEPARLFIYLDKRTTSLPGWMGYRWVNTGEWIKTLDMDMRYSNIHQCVTTPGHIILGGPRMMVGRQRFNVHCWPGAVEEGAAIQRCSADALDPPAAPQLIKPANLIYESNPLFVWRTVPQATQYLFHINNNNSDVFHEEIFEKIDICGSDNKCKINMTLPYGTIAGSSKHAMPMG